MDPGDEPGDEPFDDEAAANAVQRYWEEQQQRSKGQGLFSSSSTSQGGFKGGPKGGGKNKGKNKNKGGGKGGKGKKGSDKGKDPGVKHSMQIAGLLRHGNIPGWLRCPRAIQETGGFGEMRLTSVSRFLRIDTSTVERIAQESQHPSGDYRYELFEWDNEVYVRALRKHSIQVHREDDTSAQGEVKDEAAEEDEEEA